MDAVAVLRELGRCLEWIDETMLAANLPGATEEEALQFAQMGTAIKELGSVWESTWIRQADLVNGSKGPVDEVLHATNKMSRAEAKATLRFARDLDTKYSILDEAWHDGSISRDQVRAIVRGLRTLPIQVNRETWVTVQNELVDLAQRHDPPELRQLAAHYYRVLVPEEADEREARLAELDARQAYEARTFSLEPDHHGSYLISGQVPQVLGERLAAQLDAAMRSAESYRDAGQPVPTRGARRADALGILVGLVDASDGVPQRNGERPTILTIMTADALTSRQGAAHSLATGETIAPSEARVMACDANLARIILGDHGEVLDLGRTQRLFKGALRRALTARDRGCAFPGCDVHAALCDGHHIVPWQQGGPTSLSNAVLLCKFHHRLVEPDPTLKRALQWQVHIDAVTGLPMFTTPSTMFGRAEDRCHHRYAMRNRSPTPTDGTSAPSSTTPGTSPSTNRTPAGVG